MASRINVFLAELKRRKVGRSAFWYAGAGFAFASGAEYIFDLFQLPIWAARIVAILVLAGFPIALVLSWFVEITPAGVRRTHSVSPEELAAHSPVRWTRTTWALAGLGTLVVVTVGYLAVSRATATSHPATRVALFPIENHTGDPSFDYLGVQAAFQITAGLERAEHIDVFPVPEGVASTAVEAEGESQVSTVRQDWASRLPATLAVVGNYFSVGDSIQFGIQIVDSTGKVNVSVNPVSGPAANLSQALGELQWRVASAVAGIVTPGSLLARVNLHSHLPAREALDLYLDGRRVKGTEGSGAAVDYFLRAMEADPEYLAPLIQLIWVRSNLQQWQGADSLCTLAEARSDGMTRFERLDMEGGCARARGDFTTALEKARLILEYLPNAYGDVGVLLLALNRPREAVEAFLNRDPHYSQDDWEWTSRMWTRLGEAYHMLGQFEDELQVGRGLRENFPDDLRGFEVEVSALTALGRLEELDTVMEEWIHRRPPQGDPSYAVGYFAAFELDAHGYSSAAGELRERSIQRYESYSDPEAAPDGARWYSGLAYLFLDRPEEARRIFEAFVPQMADGPNLLGNLGVAAAKLGDPTEADRVDQRLSELVQPFDRGEHTLRRAWIRANLGDRARAVELLEQAVAEGFNDWISLHSSPWLKSLRGYPPFEEFIRPKG